MEDQGRLGQLEELITLPKDGHMAQIKPTWANESQSEGLSRSYQKKQTSKQSSPGRCGVQISSGTDIPFCFMREEGRVVRGQHMEHEAKTTEGREERKRETGALEPTALEPLTSNYLSC